MRRSGEANIEVELREGTDIVSSFYVKAYIEKTSKEDITSDNASTYIEEFEKAIAKLRLDSQELLESISTSGDEKIEDIETRYTAITEELNELLANYGELQEYIATITNSIDSLVDQRMLSNTKIATKTIPHKTTVDGVEQDTTITNGYEVTLPDGLQYQVGNNSLEVRLNSIVLIRATDTQDGHYKEVGQAGALSNKITFYRTEADGNWVLYEDITMTFVIRGVAQGGTE